MRRQTREPLRTRLFALSFSRKFFHAARSLMRKGILASESSPLLAVNFGGLAITCHEFFSESSSDCHRAV